LFFLTPGSVRRLFVEALPLAIHRPAVTCEKMVRSGTPST
jgi:hypothetical protein